MGQDAGGSAILDDALGARRAARRGGRAGQGRPRRPGSARTQAAREDSGVREARAAVLTSMSGHGADRYLRRLTVERTRLARRLLRPQRARGRARPDRRDAARRRSAAGRSSRSRPTTTRIRPATPSAGGTARNASMFGPPGHAYVYRSYGIHWCLNLVCEEEGSPRRSCSAALEPTHGIERMQATAPDATTHGCSAPGRAGSARRSPSRASTTASPLDEPPFELRARTGRARGRRGAAHRDHTRRRAAVALRPRRLLASLSPGAYPERDGHPRRRPRRRPAGRCRTISCPRPADDRAQLQPLELACAPAAASGRRRWERRRGSGFANTIITSVERRQPSPRAGSA